MYDIISSFDLHQTKIRMSLIVVSRLCVLTLFVDKILIFFKEKWGGFHSMHLKCVNVNDNVYVKVRCPNNYVLKTIERFRLPMKIKLTFLVVNSEIKLSLAISNLFSVILNK